MPRKRWTTVDLKRLREMAGTISGAEAACAFGVTHHALKSFASRNGVKLRRRGEGRHNTRHSDATRRAVVSLRAAGMSYAAIASELGLPSGVTAANIWHYEKRRAA